MSQPWRRDDAVRSCTAPCVPPADGQDQLLVILSSKSPLGPFVPHLNGTFAVEAAATLGPVFRWRNSLHRLGRACRAGECGPAMVHQVSTGLMVVF